jgi:hypothetical protein
METTFMIHESDRLSAGADELIQLIDSKVIAGKNIIV